MFNFSKKKIGIIGFGNMGQAIADRIKSKYEVFVFEKDREKTKGLTGITVSLGISQLLKQSESIILAVKPQDFGQVITELKGSVQGKLIISIAAGITTGYIEKSLGQPRVVRVMPNLAVKVGKSTTSICKGAFAASSDIKLARRLFKYLGKVFILTEDMMDAATAIAGSGPAYIFYDMEIKKIDSLKIPKALMTEYIKKLMDAAMEVDFDPKTSLALSIDTAASSVGLLAQTGKTPAQLRKMITSPGGTTEAALKVIINGGSWSEAAVTAKKRARELSKKE